MKEWKDDKTLVILLDEKFSLILYEYVIFVNKIIKEFLSGLHNIVYVVFTRTGTGNICSSFVAFT